MEGSVNSERFIHDKSIAKAAGEHAKAEYPNESVGVIIEGSDGDCGLVYLPLENTSDDPTNEFTLGARPRCPIHGLIHSHTMGTSTAPSRTDMMSQQAMGIPWGILHADGKIFSPLLWIGDQLPVAPLIGRDFISGHHDCWALVRDVYRTQFGIVLENYPRNEDWYMEEGSEDLMGYENIIAAGFIVVDKQDTRQGDVLLGRVGRAGVSNHCGIVTGNELVLHQLANARSRREPRTPWMKFIYHVARHKSLTDSIPSITFNR